MTMRERAIEAINNANSNLTIEGCKAMIAQKQKSIEWHKNSYWSYRSASIIKTLKNEIAYFEAVIEVLTECLEAATLEIANEAVQAVVTLTKTMPTIKVMRKVVASMANKLRKLGYSLSDCFKRAWSFVKGAMSYVSYTSFTYQAAA